MKNVFLHLILIIKRNTWDDKKPSALSYKLNLNADELAAIF